MAKTLIVTGAGGFLGRHLLPVLVEEGHTVIAVSSKKREELVFDGLAGVIAADDFESLKTALGTADILVNCAFPRNVDGYSMGKGMDYLTSLFSVAGDSGVGAVVNISSQCVYSQSRNEAADEAFPLCLETKYAVAKYAAELLLDARCMSVPHTNIRLASLIGIGFDQRVTNVLVKKALDGSPLEIRDNGSVFAYLDVEDAAMALAKLVIHDPLSWKRVYNLGPNGGYSLTDIAENVVDELEAVGVSVSFTGTNSVEREPVVSLLDSTFFQESFSWSPTRTLNDTITAIIAYETKKRR